MVPRDLLWKHDEATFWRPLGGPGWYSQKYLNHDTKISRQRLLYTINTKVCLTLDYNCCALDFSIDLPISTICYVCDIGKGILFAP